MKTVLIDGKVFEIVRTEPGHLCVKVFVRPQGSEGGPHACHSVPVTVGSYRTNGHTYNF